MGLSGFLVIGVLLRGAWRERKARMQVNFNLNNMRDAMNVRKVNLPTSATRSGEAGRAA